MPVGTSGTNSPYFVISIPLTECYIGVKALVSILGWLLLMSRDPVSKGLLHQFAVLGSGDDSR